MFKRLLFRLFRDNETKLHELKYLFWECTTRCNLRCLHCGSDCGGADSAPADMPFDDFLNAILPLKTVYPAHSISIQITGGEPLMRRDLADCGRRLAAHGFFWGIVTNGLIYTKDIHSKLLDAGMSTITVSLDGLKETHNHLRGRTDSFDAALNALCLIANTRRSSGAPRLNYDVVTCVHKKNIQELEALRDLLISKNIKAWRLFTIAPIGRAAGVEDFSLNSAELNTLMRFIKNERAARRIGVTFSCEAYTGIYENHVRDSFFFCRAGINIASVLIDGSISACPNINRAFAQGSIYRDNFLDVWNTRFALMRNRNWMKRGLCARCTSFADCKGGAFHLWNENRADIVFCHNKTLEGREHDKRTRKALS
jgi:radical SAM enzyme (rSAM/lipoprotein system)